ncbi:MAG: class I SAM-dependent methyltransferase [Candidatus Eisenbacteria bacterium]
MDPFRFTTIAHATHEFCNPVGAATLDRFVAALDLPPAARVLDAGCGKAELLIRIAEHWEAHGVGVDVNPAFLAEARARAAGRVREVSGGLPGSTAVGARLPNAAARLEPGPHGSIELIESAVAEAGLSRESFDLAICVGSTHVFGELAEALAALRDLLRPGGQLLFGHGYWQREPAPEYLAGFGATRDELGSHEDNLAALARAGFQVIDLALSSPADWDAYEERYARNVERFFAEHPDDPDRGAFLARIRVWHGLYRKWGRDTMGFALYRARKS